MWVISCVVWEFEGNGPTGEEDESEGGLGGVEPVGAPDEQPDFGVESFMTAVGQDRRVRLVSAAWLI